MSATPAPKYPILAKVADGAAGGTQARPAPAPDGGADEAERRRQIQAILDQGDRDIAADKGRDWDEVKRRMRERVAARSR
jgi:hypothetical protein